MDFVDDDAVNAILDELDAEEDHLTDDDESAATDVDSELRRADVLCDEAEAIEAREREAAAAREREQQRERERLDAAAESFRSLPPSALKDLEERRHEPHIDSWEASRRSIAEQHLSSRRASSVYVLASSSPSSSSSSSLHQLDCLRLVCVCLREKEERERVRGRESKVGMNTV